VTGVEAVGDGGEVVDPLVYTTYGWARVSTLILWSLVIGLLVAEIVRELLRGLPRDAIIVAAVLALAMCLASIQQLRYAVYIEVDEVTIRWRTNLGGWHALPLTSLSRIRPTRIGLFQRFEFDPGRGFFTGTRPGYRAFAEAVARRRGISAELGRMVPLAEAQPYLGDGYKPTGKTGP